MTRNKRSISPGPRDGQRPPKVARPTNDSVPGIIQRVRLERFMCHDELDWEPNRHVNFVTGVNGSGKSSILQGLVLGLLAESKHTKRYGKLQEFIQKGYSKAVIQVTLKNDGEDAWKPDLYGASITFLRTINESGTSAVYIKDHKENVVKKTTKDAREEGKRILENFRINTDNPIAILQQEEAKELLKVESPQNLYTFFQKATLLKQCIDQYSAAKTELEKTRETIERKQVLIKDLGKQLNDKFKKMQHLSQLIERDQEEERFQKEYLWALVEQNETEIKTIGLKISQKETAMENPKEKLKALHQFKVSLENLLTNQQDKADQERNQFAKEEEDLQDVKHEIEKLKEDEKSLKSKCKGYDSTISTIESEIRIMKDQFEQQMKESKGKDKIAQAKARKRKLEQLESKKNLIQDDIEQLGKERDVVESGLDVNKRSLEKCEYDRKGTQRKYEKLTSDLKEMEGLGDQRLAVFDRMAPRVAEEIRMAENLHKFGVTPIGPVGSHLRLCNDAATNSELARLVETEIGTNHIKAYLCNDDGDRRVLWDIMNRVYGGQKKPQIFTSKFLSDRHRVKRVPSEFSTVMDYLEFTGGPLQSTVVFNHLVDQKSIESVVVCKTQQEAKRICTYQRDVPRNMNYAITWDFNRFFPPTHTTSYRSYFIDPKPSQMLGASMNNKVEELRLEIEKSNGILKEISLEADEVKSKARELESSNKSIRSRISERRQQLQLLSSEKSQLKAEEDGDDSLESLKEKLEEKSTELDRLTELRDEVFNEKDEIQNLYKAKSKEYVIKAKEVSGLRETLLPIEKEISKIEGQISSKKKEITNQEKVVKRYQNEVGILKKEQHDKKTEEKKFRTHANRQCSNEYVQPTGSVMQLNAKIKQIRESKKKTGNVVVKEEKDRLVTEYRTLKEQYKTQNQKITSIDEHLKLMEEMDQHRHNNLLFIRSTITNMVHRRFASLSQVFSKQFGSQIFINVNHKRRELDFTFKNAEGDNISTDINSLSGGEKSYAQMCLIASLWEHMNPPFRALDEWDVFLDAINRKNISKTLMEFGLSKLEYQFIFISPQGAGDIKYDPSDSTKVSILEVKKHS